MNRRQALHTMGATALGLAAGGRDATGQVADEVFIRGGRVVNANSTLVADVRIIGDTIQEIGPDLVAGAEARIIDAVGQLVIPGGIDPHTHL